jgi:hypothetical protein
VESRFIPSTIYPAANEESGSDDDDFFGFELFSEALASQRGVGVPAGRSDQPAAVVGGGAIGFLALLFWTRDLLGAHQQDGFDRSSAHDVVDGGLGVLNQVEHRQERLPVRRENLGKLLGLRGGRPRHGRTRWRG